MNRQLARILLALSSADVSARDLKEFLHWLDLNGPERLVELVYMLRETAERSQNEIGRGLFSDRTVETSNRLSERRLVGRIERLMLESGLPKVAIVKATHQLLMQRGYSASSLPAGNKIAFTSWIGKLLGVAKAEDLLNVASLIRNRAVHGIDWPLHRDKS